MAKRRAKWEIAVLTDAVRASRSIASTLRCLGLRPAGANYEALKREVRLLGLDTSHWTGKGHRRGSTIPVASPRPLSDYLRKGVACNTRNLKRRLLDAGVLPFRCAGCGLAEWLGGPIPLELDHVDGDRENNDISNLKLLCPNCHALTPTYRGRNIRIGRGGARRSVDGDCLGGEIGRHAGLSETLSPHREIVAVKPVKLGEGPGQLDLPEITPSQALQR